MQANIAAEKSEIRASNMKWAPTRQKECRTCSDAYSGEAGHESGMNPIVIPG
jgi:hypothetical protein